MNEIERFKKNRMIPKGLYGLKPHEILGAGVNGLKVAYVNIPGKGYIAVDANGNAYRIKGEDNRGKIYLHDFQFVPIKLSNYDRYHVYKAATRQGGMTGYNNILPIANYWASLGNPKVATKPVTTKISNETSTEVPVKTPKTPVVKSNVTPRKSIDRRPLKSQELWDSDFQTMKNGLSPQLLMYLDSLGINTSNAEEMQTSINKYLGNNNLVVDNKWGTKSQNALNSLLAYMSADYQNDDMKQTNDVVIDAPDPFGYKTSNTYEGSDFAGKMKKIGIRSNADLINFMHNSSKEGWTGDAWQTQFRSDVDKALGGDYSDANIRKVFGTQGKWGKGFMGKGDLGDFQNALQVNTGVWNGMYDLKELASRTGKDGTTYSSPEIMRKFESIKVPPEVKFGENKFDFSNMKFNLNFGNTGTNTLGNIGTLNENTRLS